MATSRPTQSAAGVGGEMVQVARRAGGVADAVNRGAQAAYDTLTSGQQDAARLVFTQLTVITADGRLTRRRCRRADLSPPGTPMAADVDAGIGVFSARHLLVLGEDSVEIAHDALLQARRRHHTDAMIEKLAENARAAAAVRCGSRPLV